MGQLDFRKRQEAAPDQEDLEPEPLKDRSFNPWRAPKSERARIVVEDVIRQVQNYEKFLALRRRRRKQSDQRIFEVSVSALVCDLMHHHLTGAEGGLFVTRSNDILGRKSRYRSPVYGKTLPDILDRMASPEMAFILQHKAYKNPFSPDRRTTIHSGDRLITRIEDHGITLSDLRLSLEQEVIILKQPKDGIWDEGEPTEYDDTPVTRQYREEIRYINEWLEEADIEIDEAELDGRLVDATYRRLRRIFTRERFDSGGRVFGGFWQNLSKRQRLRGIQIQGEPAVELDYGQMAPRILYGLCGAALPSQDLYLVSGLERFRNGVKKLMNAMLFATQRLTRMPQNLRAEFGDHRVAEVMGAIEGAHSAIKEHFFTGIGHRLQFAESQILVALLLSLRDEGIVGLPVHDAVLIPSSKINETKHFMLSLFQKHTGVEGMVDEKRQDLYV